MEPRKDREQKVEEIMNSLDGIERAGPGPWFYTRLVAGINREEKSFWSSAGSFLARPSVAIASLCLVLLLNVVLLLQQSDSTPSVSSVVNSENVVESESIIASSSSFDYENFAP